MEEEVVQLAQDVWFQVFRGDASKEGLQVSNRVGRAVHEAGRRDYAVRRYERLNLL